MEELSSILILCASLGPVKSIGMDLGGICSSASGWVDVCLSVSVGPFMPQYVLFLQKYCTFLLRFVPR